MGTKEATVTAQRHASMRGRRDGNSSLPVSLLAMIFRMLELGISTNLAFTGALLSAASSTGGDVTTVDAAGCTDCTVCTACACATGAVGAAVEGAWAITLISVDTYTNPLQYVRTQAVPLTKTISGKREFVDTHFGAPDAPPALRAITTSLLLTMPPLAVPTMWLASSACDSIIWRAAGDSRWWTLADRASTGTTGARSVHGTLV